MARLSRYVIIGVIGAEVFGWLLVYGLWRFYSIGMASQNGLAVPIALMAIGGAIAGVIAWAVATAVRRR